MMMKQVAGCTLIEDRTAGVSGNPRRVDLGNSVTVFVPRWWGLRLDGTCLEGEGFAPDIAVRVGAAGFEHGDTVIEQTLSVLRNGERALTRRLPKEAL